MKARHAKPGHPYLYLFLLILSCLLVLGGYFVYNALHADDPSDGDTSTTTVVTTTTTTTTTTQTTASTTTSATESDTVTTTEGTGGTVTSTTAGTTTTKAPATTTKSGTTNTTAAGKISLPDTLFIGDSRTHGLSLYGKISDADFFAKTSLSSFSVLKDTSKVSINGLGEVTLKQLLQKRQYKTVYIMLGINEIGYAMKNIVAKYEELISVVRQYQPDAVIVLQSTIHVRADKEKPANGVTNKNINTLNGYLEAMADGTTIRYLNVNTVFDDENGAMGKEYSNDGVHFYSKYYLLWRDFIAANHPQ